MSFPVIDGHFWIVREGKIIDPHFEVYDMYCNVRNCDSKAEKSYIPAPQITQTIMLGMYKKVLTKTFGDKSFEELAVAFRDISKKYGFVSEPNSCYQNCLIEIAENGGEIVFGSMGFKYKSKKGYFYEYGGDEYKTIKQFLK
jgi:hypothetical protein